MSEAQERMVLAVAPDKLPAFLELCRIEDVEATDLGEFTGDGSLDLYYGEQLVGRLKMEFLHKGIPRRHMTATWQAPAPRPIQAPGALRTSPALSGLRQRPTENSG